MILKKRSVSAIVPSLVTSAKWRDGSKTLGGAQAMTARLRARMVEARTLLEYQRAH
jgi:hypothetical protein